MTTEQRTTVIDRVLRLVDEKAAVVRWFRQNACMRHGLPLDEPAEIKITVDSPSPLSPPAAAPTPPQAAEGKTPGWLLAALAGAGLGGAGLAGYAASALSGDAPPGPAQAVAPAEPSGSLLQDLEDRGFHLDQ